MKKAKRFLSVFCCILACVTMFTKDCCLAVKKKEVKIGTYLIRIPKDRLLEERIREIEEHLKKGHRIIILCGGSYYHTAKAAGFEAHHLISSHFCRNHFRLLRAESPEAAVRYAPAVLIPKPVHYFTRSHIQYRGRDAMLDYFEEEEKAYKCRNSLHDVVRFGLKDLNRAFKEYQQLNNPTATPIKSSDVIIQTPIADALAQVDALSPNRTPIKRTEFLTPGSATNLTSTPLTAKAPPKRTTTPCTPPRGRKAAKPPRTPPVAKKRPSPGNRKNRPPRSKPRTVTASTY